MSVCAPTYVSVSYHSSAAEMETLQGVLKFTESES